MAQYKSYTHVLRIDKDEVQGILCGDVVIMPKLDGTNACLFMKDDTVHAGSRTREININKDNANFCKKLLHSMERKSFLRLFSILNHTPTISYMANGSAPMVSDSLAISKIISITDSSSLMYLTQQRTSIFRTIPTRTNLETMTKLFL